MSASRSMRRDLALNVAGTGWGALVQFACIPIYLAYLGTERYGLLAFATTMQLTLKALDLGVSHTVNRELASRSASGRTEGVRELLRTLEVVYVAVGALLGGALAAAAPSIAQHWFGASTLGGGPVTHAVRLIGLLVALQWPLSLHQGALLGLGRARTMNTAAIIAATLSGGGSVLLLLSGSRSLDAVLAWQCVVACGHTIAVVIAAHRALPRHARPARVRLAAFRELRATIAGVGTLTLSFLFLLQIDKLLASRWLPLAAYGQYMLGATVSNGLGVLSAPVFNTFLPRLAAHAARGDMDALRAEFRRGTRLLALFVFPAMITAGVLAADLLALWTHDASLARTAAAPATLLLVGMGAASILQLAMALQMATGRTGLGTSIHATLVVAVAIVGGIGARAGAAGVAAVWGGLVALGALAGGVAIYRRQLGSGSVRWLAADVVIPLAAMLVTTAVVWPVLSAPVSPSLAALRLLALGLLLTTVSALACGVRPSMLAAALDPTPRAS